MLRLMETLMKTLRSQWRTMGRSSFMALFVLMGLAYLVLSLQLLVEFIRSQISRGLTRYDDMRAVQSWDKAPPPPHIEIDLPPELSFRTRIDQTRKTVVRHQHETEQRVERRAEMLRRRIIARRVQHAKG